MSEITPYDFELEDTLTGDGREAQLRRVKFLLATPVGTIPADREFGIETDFLGRPMATAQALYAAEIVSKIKEFCPSVKVKKVTWTGGADGKLWPKVVITDA